MKTIISMSATKAPAITAANKAKIKDLQVKKRELAAKLKAAVSTLEAKHKEAVKKIDATLKALGYKKPVSTTVSKKLPIMGTVEKVREIQKSIDRRVNTTGGAPKQSIAKKPVDKRRSRKILTKPIKR